MADSQALQVINNIEPEYQRIAVSHGYGLIAKAQMAAAYKQITRNSYTFSVAEKFPQSLYNAIETAAILGVDLTEGKRQGWLLPRKDQYDNTVIVFQIGYKGIEAVHQRLGVIKRLVVQTVRKNDEWSWSGDDQEKPAHKADWMNESARGEITGAYAITYFPDDSIQVKAASVETIFRDHRDKSDSWKKEDKRKYSPWMNHTEAMIEKTMAVIASKQWPASSANQEAASKVLERLHQAETADYSDYKGDNVIQLNELHAFMLANDSLGVYLFQKAKGEELTKYYWWPDTPKGLKGACRSNFERMTAQGLELLECIKSSINEDNPFNLKECIELATVETKRMLSRELGEETTKQIKDMLKRVSDE